MAAPDLPTLFDFESAYEDATANHFANINGNPFSQILTIRTTQTSEEFLETPRVAISFGITGTDRLHDQFIPNTATRFYDYKQGALTLTVATSRNNASQSHGNLRGRARQAMLEVTAVYNSNSLPYYSTVYVTEQGSVQSVDPVNDEIITQLTYAVDFAIKPGAWPAS